MIMTIVNVGGFLPLVGEKESLKDYPDNFEIGFC